MSKALSNVFCYLDLLIKIAFILLDCSIEYNIQTQFQYETYKFLSSKMLRCSWLYSHIMFHQDFCFIPLTYSSFFVGSQPPFLEYSLSTARIGNLLPHALTRTLSSWWPRLTSAACGLGSVSSRTWVTLANARRMCYVAWTPNVQDTWAVKSASWTLSSEMFSPAARRSPGIWKHPMTAFHVSIQTFACQPSNLPLTNFLLTVSTGNSMQCMSGRPMTLTAPSGYLGSAASSTGTGTARCPYRLEAEPGQQFNISVYNFNYKGDNHCREIASAWDGGSSQGVKRPITVCSRQSRVSITMVSTSNIVDIHFSSSLQSSDIQYLLQYESMWQQICSFTKLYGAPGQ